MRTILPILLVLLALPALASAQDVVTEEEPNDDPKTATQEIRPGQVYRASIHEPGDVDCVILRCEREQVITFRWLLDEGVRLSSIKIGKMRSSPRRTRDLRLIRLRVPVGRTMIEIEHHVRAATGGYRMETTVEEDSPGLETEPNGESKHATPLPLGTTMTAWISSSWPDTDIFGIEVAERGIYRLRIERLEAPPPPEDDRRKKGRLRVKVLLKTGEANYHYEVDDLAETFEFFPVLPPGSHDLLLGPRGGAVGAPYRLLVERFDVAVPPESEAAARRAVERGLGWLVAADDETDRASYAVAAKAIALMALCEGGDRDGAHARRVASLVAEIGRAAVPEEGGSWQGAPVVQFGRRMYEHAFATLALAEAAAFEIEGARELCREGVRLLLAAQISERRPEAWKVTVGAGQLGGWRYTPRAKAGDLSVGGWCLIALYAAAAADVEVEGLTEAGEWGAGFVQGCAVSTVGFRYQPGTGGRPSAIGQSIGVLVSLLFGQSSAAVRAATADIDLHLCAGTQTAHGQNCPFYYWYYATRAHYLRGGYAWEAWRAVAIRQLVRRQEEDGSWAPLHEERAAGRRYSTGMAVMILRLCLGEPPFYLSREVEGF